MLKKILKSKKFRKSMIIFGVLVIGVMAYMTISKYIGKYKGVEGNENASKTLALFHMNNCGHCVALMPKWDEAATKNNKGGGKIKMVKYETGDDGADVLLKKFNVNGFPTMILMGPNKNELDRYTGERTTAGILDYLKQQSS
jgi:thiol-disulfide isomerase/thioredoxin